MASGVKDGISLEVSIRDTGMGLFICRNIIEAHGGDIVVESKAGKGTEVKVLFPLAG